MSNKNQIKPDAKATVSNSLPQKGQDAENTQGEKHEQEPDPAKLELDKKQNELNVESENFNKKVSEFAEQVSEFEKAKGKFEQEKQQFNSEKETFEKMKQEKNDELKPLEVIRPDNLEGIDAEAWDAYEKTAGNEFVNPYHFILGYKANIPKASLTAAAKIEPGTEEAPSSGDHSGGARVR